ncbi:MAG: CYTH and CHAD domain-containing protein [Rhodospirillaceae bacterium]
MATEVELKLQMDRRHLERLRRHPAIQELKQGRAVTRTLTSVYFDTARHHLYDAGVSLRIRHIGARRIQAVKVQAANGAGSSHLSRDEWEQEIAGDQPDHQALREAGIAGVIARASGGNTLHPVFTTRFRRTTYCLGNGTWEMELTLDLGEVEAGQTTAPICEAELELKRGSPADLYSVARRLAQDLPLRVALGSKADRGFDLVTGRTPSAVKADRLTLRPDMTGAQAFQAIGRACLHHLLLNEPALRDGRQPEAVHQMRVALRRLRSAMSIFGEGIDGPETESIKAELKWITAQLGAARDLDVFTADILGPVLTEAADDGGLTALQALFQARRDEAYERALAAVDQPRYAQMVLDVGAWLETLPLRDSPRLAQPIETLAPEIMTARHGRTLKKGRHFKSLGPAQRHRLRIHIKKLRYATEFFESLMGRKKAAKFAANLAALQDDLGHLNDIDVAQTLIRDCIAEGTSPNDSTLSFAAGEVIGWHRAQAKGAKRLAVAARGWKRFTRAKRFWR